MSHLRLQVFGELNVVAGGRWVLPIAASCRPVLGYVLTHRQRRVSKAELAETLWSDRNGEQARHCLSTALWRLKKSTHARASLLTFDGADHVSFNWQAPVWVDAVAMELRLAPLLKCKPEALGDEALRRLEHGVRLYRGEFLAGMDYEWARLERQRLRDLYCDGLYQLMLGHAAAQAWNDVLTWGRRLSREEPLREDVHRMLMLANLRTGNRASALRQYRECERVLGDDLGIEPMAETQALHRQLLAPCDAGDSFDATAQVRVHETLALDTSALDTPALEQAQRRIVRVCRILVVCQRQLDQANDALAAHSARESS